ncbi:MAG TPA: tetratricopeptide repeat protein [Terriglobales bacterium]|nr:tetratricopeptide repeat protein [Terriglobales bacterium]
MQVRNRTLSLLLTLISLLFVAFSAFAQGDRFAAGNGSPDMGFFSNGSISGTLVDGSGQPVPNARVELRSVLHGEVLAIATTNYAGEYHLNNVSRGDYEIIGLHGLAETRDRVSVMMGNSTINLRLQDDTSARNVEGTNTVSVNDYKVPDKARKALHKAQQAFEVRKYQNAARYIDEAISIFPGYAEALTLRGLLALQNHHTDAAQQDLEKALQLDAGHSITYFLLAAVYNETGHFDDALRTSNEGVRIAPNAWQAYFEMSKALLGKNQFGDALRQASKGLELNPGFAMLHVIKGDCFAGLKDYTNAISEMQAYLIAEPAGAVSSQVRATVARMRALLPPPTPAPPVVGNLVASQQ